MLHAAALSVIMNPESRRELELSSRQIEQVRSEVSTTRRSSEKHLSILSHLFANRLTHGHYSCQSVVTANAAGSSFTLSQSVPAEVLSGGEDSYTIAEKQLRELRFNTRSEGEQSSDSEWAETTMVDHMLEFEAHRHNEWGVHRIISHSRSSSDYWKLISDSFFGIDCSDGSFSSDDSSEMHNIKIVVEDADYAEALHKNLRNFYWNDKELRDHGAPVDFATRRLDLLEQSSSGRRRSSTFNWLGTLLSVEVITLDEHYEETESMHMKHKKDQRQLIADQLSAESPLFRFSRELLQWIGESPISVAPPSCANIAVSVCL